MDQVAKRIADNIAWPGALAQALGDYKPARLKRDLLRIADNVEFVHQSYRVAIGRDVNPIELRLQVRRLERFPFYRRVMLFRLFRCPEARQRADRLSGERLVYLEELWQSLRQEQLQQHQEQLRLFEEMLREQRRQHLELVGLLRGEPYKCAS
jgi:hypothetical protein